MPESETKLDELVGEGKKFKTAEDLAKAKLESDAFIEQLKTETQTLRDELAKLTPKADANDTLEKLMEALKNNNAQGSPTDEPTKPKEPVNQTGALTSEDIVKIMEAREQSRLEASNLNQSLAAFRRVHGEKTDEALNQKAVDLGVSRDEIEAIAKKSPSAFANLVGLNRQPESTTRSMAREGVHLQQNPAQKDGVRNKAYYDNVRKEMGISKFIMDKSLQIQLHRDMMRLGDEWDPE